MKLSFLFTVILEVSCPFPQANKGITKRAFGKTTSKSILTLKNNRWFKSAISSSESRTSRIREPSNRNVLSPNHVIDLLFIFLLARESAGGWGSVSQLKGSYPSPKTPDSLLINSNLSCPTERQRPKTTLSYRSSSPFVYPSVLCASSALSVWLIFVFVSKLLCFVFSPPCYDLIHFISPRTRRSDLACYEFR